MKHPTEEKLRAYMDGELPIAAAADVASHLSDCADCSAAAAGLRETAEVFAGAMARMDAAEPGRWAVRAGGGAMPFSAAPSATNSRWVDQPANVLHGDAAPGGTTRSRPPLARDLGHAPRARTSGSAVWRWAAGIALLVAAGGSAAIATGLLDFTTAMTTSEREPVATAATPPAPGSGVFATPRDGAIEVVLTRAPAGSRVIVELTDQENAFVEVMGVTDATTPRFVNEVGRVVVDLGDQDRVVRVTMPRGLNSASVVWQGRIVVQVADGAVTPENAVAGGVLLSERQ